MSYIGTLLNSQNGGTGVDNGTNTLTINANSVINQDVSTTAPVTFLSAALTSGTVTNMPSSSNDIVNKAYADSIAAGVSFLDAAYCASTADLGAIFYTNGSAGVGAQIFGPGVNIPLILDGLTVPLNKIVVIKNQVSSFQNGLYKLTAIAISSSPYVLTRLTTYDQPSEILPGTLIPVEFGNTLAGSSWVQTATVTTIGTDPINFSQFSYPATTNNTPYTVVLRDGSGNYFAGIASLLGVKIKSPGTFYMLLANNDTLTADRTLNFVLNDNDRQLTIGADVALNQDLTTTSSPTFTAVNAGAITATGLLTSQAGRVKKIRVVTVAGAVTVTSTDENVVINKTVGAATVVNLPAPGSAAGQEYTIIDGKADAGTNNITLTPASGTINGSATYVINSNSESITIIDNGTQYNIK